MYEVDTRIHFLFVTNTQQNRQQKFIFIQRIKILKYTCHKMRNISTADDISVFTCNEYFSLREL